MENAELELGGPRVGGPRAGRPGVGGPGVGGLRVGGLRVGGLRVGGQLRVAARGQPGNRGDPPTVSAMWCGGTQRISVSPMRLLPAPSMATMRNSSGL